MDVGSILNYEADPNEDYYGLLGCDSSASTEQIIAEYKARAKDCHPDRNSAVAQPQSREKFQHLLRVSHATILNVLKNKRKNKLLGQGGADRSARA